MDYTHIHLAITHFPIIGSLIGFLIFLYGLFSKNYLIKQVSYGIFILSAIVTIPVFISGGQSEEMVESLAGISETLIEEHEELAEVAIWFIGVLGFFALIGLVFPINGTKIKLIFQSVMFVLILATMGIFFKVGNLGGQIRHSEIRSSANSTDSGGQIKPFYKYESEDHEEDD